TEMDRVRIDRNTWHGRLICLWYAMYDRNAPETMPNGSYKLAVAGALIFFAGAIVILVVVNAGALLFGVFLQPPWRGGAEFRVIWLPGRIPLIAICMPILIAYALWRSWLAHGLIATLAPFIMTGTLAAGLFTAAVIFNRARGRGLGE